MRTNRSTFQRHKNSSIQDMQMNAAGRFPHGVHLHLEKETVKGYTNPEVQDNCCVGGASPAQASESSQLSEAADVHLLT